MSKLMEAVMEVVSSGGCTSHSVVSQGDMSSMCTGYNTSIYGNADQTMYVVKCCAIWHTVTQQPCVHVCTWPCDVCMN